MNANQFVIVRLDDNVDSEAYYAQDLNEALETLQQMQQLVPHTEWRIYVRVK